MDQRRHYMIPIGSTFYMAFAAGILAGTVATSAVAAANTPAASGSALPLQNNCLACHGMTNKIVGPGFNEVMAKYKGDGTAQGRLEAKVRNGGTGVWGQIPMPPHSMIKEADIKTMVHFILTGA